MYSKRGNNANVCIRNPVRRGLWAFAIPDISYSKRGNTTAIMALYPLGQTSRRTGFLGLQPRSLCLSSLDSFSASTRAGKEEALVTEPVMIGAGVA